MVDIATITTVGINLVALAYGAGKLNQKCNGIDSKAGLAHKRVDILEEKQNDMREDIREVKTDVKWLRGEYEKNGGK